MQHHFIKTNGVNLHVVEAGPAQGPLVILLHGFPEFWYGWRYQIDALAAAGYRVWAPDGRGYNLSEKPDGVAAYALEQLVADVLGLIEAAGVAKAHIVGHDWGAIVAWWLAMTHPERVNRLVILNVPHPAVMARYVARLPRQLLKSWYVFFFQLPFLPEWLARRRNWRLMSGVMTRTSRPGTFSADALRLYRQAWSQPGRGRTGAFRAMVNWYRAALRQRPAFPADTRVTVPTLLLWGVQDAFLVPEMAPASLALCDGGTLIWFDTATHWLQHEEASAVNAHLCRFLAD